MMLELDRPETTRRASAALDLMNAALIGMTPAQRDQRLQRLLAQGMTSSQRFRAAGAIYRTLLALKFRVAPGGGDRE